jgi:hypothetical protein
MLDKILSWFVYVWVGLATALVVIDIARMIATAPSWWNGIPAAWHKWFTLNNAAELILLSPAIGAHIRREKRRDGPTARGPGPQRAEPQ